MFLYFKILWAHCALKQPERNHEVYTSGIIIYTPIYCMLWENETQVVLGLSYINVDFSDINDTTYIYIETWIRINVFCKYNNLNTALYFNTFLEHYSNVYVFAGM